MKKAVLVLPLLVGMVFASTWSDPVALLVTDAWEFTGGPGEYSQLVDNEGTLHVVFYSDFEEPENREIYYMNNRRGVWSEPLRLSHGENMSHGPSMAIDAAGNITVVWYDYRLGYPFGDIFWCRYDAATGIWSDDQPLIVTPGNGSLIPIVLAEPTGKVHLVWCDQRYGDYYDFELFYRCWENGQWSDDLQLTYAGHNFRWIPAMKLDDAGNLHLFWADDRTAWADWHIYYKKLRPDGTWTDEIDLGSGAPHDIAFYNGYLFLSQVHNLGATGEIPKIGAGIYDPVIPSQVRYSVKNLSDPDDVWVMRDMPVSDVGDFCVMQPALATCHSGVRIVWRQGTKGHTSLYQAMVGLYGQSSTERFGSILGDTGSISLSSGTKGDLNLVYVHTTPDDTGWDLYYQHDPVPREDDTIENAPRILLNSITPNPTADGAVVSFDLPATGNVEVAVYDTAGRRVATVFRGTLTEGRHELGVDTTGLCSGAYFVQAAGDGMSASAPLVVTR